MTVGADMLAPVPSHGDAEPGRCRDARTALAQHVGGGEAMRSEVREHFRGCIPCHEAYHATLEGLASAHRGRRLEREADLQKARREAQRARALEGAVGVRARPGLRLLVVCIFAVVVAARFSPAPRSDVEARLIAGEASAAGSALLEQGEGRRMRPGESCVTGADSAVELRLPGVVARVGATSHLVLEAVEPAKLRLEEGELDLSGVCALITPWGLLELEGGTVSVRLLADSAQVEELAGTGWWTDSSGRRALAEPGPAQ